MNNRVPKYFLLALLVFAFAWSIVDSFTPKPMQRNIASQPENTDSVAENETTNKELAEFIEKFNTNYDRLAPQIRTEYIKMVLAHENDFTTDAVLDRLRVEPAYPELLPELISEFLRTPSGPLQKKLFIELNKYSQNREMREQIFNALSDRIAKGPIGANEWFLSHIFSDLTEAHTPALEKALTSMPKGHPNKPLVKSLVQEMQRLKEGS